MQHKRSDYSDGTQSSLIDISSESATIKKLLAATAPPFRNNLKLLQSDEVSSLLERVFQKDQDGADAFAILESLLDQDENECGRSGEELNSIQFDFSMSDMLGTLAEDLILSLPDADVIKDDLGKRKYILSIEHFEEGTVSELTNAGQIVSLDDIFLDISTFDRLKKEDRQAWEFRMGNLEYCRITQRLVQAALSLDLQLKVSSAEKLASDAISITAGWLNAVSRDEVIVHTVKRLFQSHERIPRDFTFKERRKQTPILTNCSLCNKKWGDEFYGLGMILNYGTV